MATCKHKDSIEIRAVADADVSFVVGTTTAEAVYWCTDCGALCIGSEWVEPCIVERLSAARRVR